MKKLLINFVYYHPVGHVVEAIKYTKGFKEANSELEIHVALNKYTATNLTEGAPWIEKTYLVDVYGFLNKIKDHSTLNSIPKDWDYVMTDNRLLLDNKDVTELGKDEEAMINYHNLAEVHLNAKKGKGVFFHKRVLPPGLEYKLDAKVELDIPQVAKSFVKKYKANGPKICVLPGGSAGLNHYPDVESWQKILRSLAENISNLKIYLTGAKKSKDGRTDTSAYSEQDIRDIQGRNNIVDCFDIGLWNQIALIEMCDILLSPHTGFAFLAPCVDTPWLALSGAAWPEYFFNQVPFYSVLPNNPEYPYMGEFNEDEGPEKIISMRPNKLEPKIPEIVEAAQLLLDKNFTYEKAFKRHRENISRANIRRDKIPTKPIF